VAVVPGAAGTIGIDPSEKPTTLHVRPWHIGCLDPHATTKGGGHGMATVMNGNGIATANTHGAGGSTGPAAGYHDAVSAFKRRLIETTLVAMRGNRTHTARALGLQRTYLLRLIRDLRVDAPPAPPPGRSRHP
jgi:DNA-binding NtrC family response regulator